MLEGSITVASIPEEVSLAISWSSLMIRRWEVEDIVVVVLVFEKITREICGGDIETEQMVSWDLNSCG